MANSSILLPAQDFAFLYVTFGTREEAMRIGREAVEKKLAACANIFAEHTSIYRWEAKVEMAAEVAVIFKTTDTQSPKLADFIRSLHSYDTPCIVKLKPDAMDARFANWIHAETT